MTYDDKTNELYRYVVKGMKRVVRKDYSSVRRLYDK